MNGAMENQLITIPMISTVEYLFADSRRPPASRAGVLAAVPRGISPHSRAGADYGELILVATRKSDDSAMHVVGKASPELRRFKHKMVKLAA